MAIQEFRKVTELQPKSAVGHADLGDAYFQNGEYGAAIPELELALRLNPDLMLTHQTLGVVLLMQGNAEGALPHLEKMHMPELLGLAYLETGRLDGAITALHAALDSSPTILTCSTILAARLDLACEADVRSGGENQPGPGHKASPRRPEPAPERLRSPKRARKATR